MYKIKTIVKGDLIMAKANVINVKLDAETKSKLETLAFIKSKSLQDLSKELILNGLEPYADKIAEAEKLRE